MRLCVLINYSSSFVECQSSSVARVSLVECPSSSAARVSLECHSSSVARRVLTGGETLAAGIRVATDFALEINKNLGRKQVKIMDVGGGLPANYASDDLAAKNVPTFGEYADLLRRQVPELFTGTIDLFRDMRQVSSNVSLSSAKASTQRRCAFPNQ